MQLALLSLAWPLISETYKRFMIKKLLLLILSLLALASANAEKLSSEVSPSVLSKAEGAKPSRQAQDRPNIVFVMTDDQRWDSFGCYGRPEFKTETIDQLSAEGVTFDNAFYAVAICCPSRATMMTGRYFASHQSGFAYPHNKGMSGPDFGDAYPALLKKAGYRTGFVGKFGFRIPRASWHDSFDFLALKSKTAPNGEIWPMDATLEKIYSRDRDPKERTIIKGDAMIHFLDTQPKDQPFMLSVSFDAVKNDSDRDMYGPDTEVFVNQEMTVHGNWVEGKNEKLPKVVLDYCRGGRMHLDRTSTPELYQKIVRRFATQGYTVDRQVKRLMDKLEAMGVKDNTVVIYTSDNGRFHGSHGLYDKAILYDDVVKQPLIIWDGRKVGKQPAARVDAMVSSTDVAPTIMALAGVEIPEKVEGVSLTGFLDGSVDLTDWREFVFMENLFIEEMFKAGRGQPRGVKIDHAALNADMIENNRSYRSRGVRSQKYKYFVYFEHTPAIEELYDIEKDPLEMNNLAANPEYASVLEALRKDTENLYEEYSEN
ncbi:Choline-sulfatase (EC [Lentimonas sp. CC4]|nr:Choline-sulfatase (EC [Lentimonas sp. CC4]CAA6684997.1 Choline-sulfatase (EC [Lentimonas sp. CC6]CAA7077888.1 Choline-sulfatase (EC [Lentimonas sp. CC4]CAA7169813.1 Choline-sulfatase (EC [Lentimonas sp. CC21]CAA7179931.1 Choline-sulfatase (EC [Lentimonas sp. CC8]